MSPASAIHEVTLIVARKPEVGHYAGIEGTFALFQGSLFAQGFLISLGLLLISPDELFY